MKARILIVALVGSVIADLAFAAVALAAGNDVGQNLASLLRGYAAELYTGIVAIVGLVFLLNRKFTDLAMFFVAAILVGWLVFAPGQVAEAAKAIGEHVLP
jgi:hypothetical protein